jgi:hypothetical protein
MERMSMVSPELRIGAFEGGVAVCFRLLYAILDTELATAHT